MRRWTMVGVAVASVAATVPGGEIVVTPGVPVAATVEKRAARLLVVSGGLDRLTLDADYVAANAIRPALVMGRAQLELAGRREFRGRNRPVTLAIGGQRRDARAFWFDGAPDSGVDGTVGPWGLPHNRVTFALGTPREGEAVVQLPLHGQASTGSYGSARLGGRVVGLSFAVEDSERLPVATAAAGALIAQAYRGVLEGPSWEVDVMFGVRRPVRLLRLAEPMAIGALRFDRIAVRVRDRIDAAGRGPAIPEADGDPDEVVVTGTTGQRANYLLTIPRAGLSGCSRLTYDKTAAKVELSCVAAPG